MSKENPIVALHIGPVVDEVRRKIDTRGKWLSRGTIGGLAASVGGTIVAPIAVAERGGSGFEWFLPFTVGLAATVTVAVVASRIDDWIRNAVDRLSPADRLLYEKELAGFKDGLSNRPDQDGGVSPGLPKPPNNPPSSPDASGDRSPRRPLPKGLRAEAAVEVPVFAK